jgi:hypothetical protein
MNLQPQNLIFKIGIERLVQMHGNPNPILPFNYDIYLKKVFHLFKSLLR